MRELESGDVKVTVTRKGVPQELAHKVMLVDSRGVVQNVIVVADATSYVARDGLIVVAAPGSGAQPGDFWDGERIHRVEQEVAPDPVDLLNRIKELERAKS